MRRIRLEDDLEYIDPEGPSERCPRCGRASVRPGQGCAHCAAAAGKPAGAPAAASPAAPAPAKVSAAELERILVHANLLRMRGEWSRAADECVEVLRLDPANATAHSLLGDIYQDQGRANEARHWYQLALEMDPTSEADRAKLARTEETLEARKQRAEWEAVIEGRSQPIATSLLIRESLQRVVMVIGAGLCAILLVMATFVSVSEKNLQVGEEEPSVGWVQAGRRRPVTLVAETRRERELLKKIPELTGGAAGQLVRLGIEPRSQAGRVRVYVSAKLRESATTPDFRVLVMREGYRFARALHEADHQLKVVEVEVVGPSLAGSIPAETDLLFTGTLREDDLVVQPELLTPKELQSFFARVTPPLWATDLAPF